MDQIERRAFMKGAGLGVLAFTVGGAEVLLTPGAARTQGVPFRLLNANEGETIEALGETLVPGARKAGIAHFIDHQISSAGGGGAAAGAHLQRASTVCEFLSRRHRRGRPRQRESHRPEICGTVDDRSARFRQQYAPEQDRRLDRTERRVRLHHPAQRCRRCRVRNDGGLRRPRHPLPSPTSCQRRGGDMANEKVDVVIVGAGASGSVYARCWPRPARRSCCWRPVPTGRCPT